MMRHLLGSFLLACAGVATAQPDLKPPPSDPDLAHAWPAWFAGDHAKARSHFRDAAQRGHPLGQYNLAMMLLHGEGGPRRRAEACALLRRAADGGVGPACAALQQCGGARRRVAAGCRDQP